MGAPAAELYPQSLAPLFDRRRWSVRTADVARRRAFRWSLRSEQERREPALEFVFLLELFDLNEADIAPRSDEVGNYQDGSFGRLDDLAHCLSISPWRALSRDECQRRKLGTRIES
jgi:hypothetical protein